MPRARRFGKKVRSNVDEPKTEKNDTVLASHPPCPRGGSQGSLGPVSGLTIFATLAFPGPTRAAQWLREGDASNLVFRITRLLDRTP